MKTGILIAGIFKCEVHCINKDSVRFQELDIPGISPEYEWKQYYIDLNKVEAMGEFEDSDGVIHTALYMISGDSFVVNMDLDIIAEIWTNYKHLSQ